MDRTMGSRGDDKRSNAELESETESKATGDETLPAKRQKHHGECVGCVCMCGLTWVFTCVRVMRVIYIYIKKKQKKTVY
jgi:hypothetical protein